MAKTKKDDGFTQRALLVLETAIADRNWKDAEAVVAALKRASN